MSADLLEDLALSSTYIPSTASNFAIMYGCNDVQMAIIEDRIRKAGDQLHHPLLMPGIFAELERDRLVKAVEKLIDRFTLRSDRLENATWSPESDLDGKQTQEHLSLCLQSRSLMDHIRSVKRQLNKLLREIDEVNEELASLSAANQLPADLASLTSVGKKMKRRVQDIMIEYDDKIDDCNMMLCNTSLAMQTVWNHIARTDSKTNNVIAVQTRHESTQMRTIALLTMIYLPLSSVAGIFSMDMFNWEAADGESIVSKHIWLFGVLAAGLTLLTFLAWFLGTRREKVLAEKSDEYFEKPERRNTGAFV
ncbi:hypothetical protein CCHL11_04449 [Colletotrichum chlorophyti]|uniref:Magnesium transport protein CorA n=1 Tax=Colletotrichum chlorophyti TaxID=708187 RepID=A0A1Q8S4I2_9PEZI|nr:hypothetical protein CCHL11_04449 [Colletotrichum chlorophyti]